MREKPSPKREALLMMLRSEIVVGALQGLEQQIATFRRHAGELATAVEGGDFALALRATEAACHQFETITTTTMSLMEQVVPVDRLGHTMDSLGELVVRAVQLVAAAQVSDLQRAIRGPAVERAAAMFGGRFRNIDDVASFVHDEFSRINGIWIRYRSGGEQAGASVNRVVYRAAIRVAQHEVRSLGDDPDLARFLRRGLAEIEWPDVYRPCALVVAALKVHIDTKTDLQSLDQTQPSHVRTAGRQ
jgi:hypothetical protein